MAGSVVLTLSRVWFERPDRLRVETASPVARRIIVDGTAIHKWMEGQTNGVRIPLAEAVEWELSQTRRVPATADEYLLRLRGVPETELPGTAAFPVRRAYTPAPPQPYTEVSLDASGRLARIEVFAPASHSNLLLRVGFSGWKEPKPNLWIPCLHRAESKGRDGTIVEETLRVSALVVNEPIGSEQFDVQRWLPGVAFITPEQMAEVLRRGDQPPDGK